MNTEIIITERLLLRPLSSKHLSIKYVNWMNDSDINKFLESGGDYDINKLASFLKEQESKKILFWAIHLKKSDKHIGNIKIDPIDKDKKTGEYGILMGDKNEWGKGYAKEASQAVIKFCFEHIGLKKIELGVVENNLNAIKLYEKIGFSLDKVIKNHGVYQNRVCNYLRMSKNYD